MENKIIITNQILISSNNSVYQLLKDRGAPIIGTLFLQMDMDNYDWRCLKCPITREVTYSWFKKESK